PATHPLRISLGLLRRTAPLHPPQLYTQPHTEPHTRANSTPHAPFHVHTGPTPRNLSNPRRVSQMQPETGGASECTHTSKTGTKRLGNICGNNCASICLPMPKGLTSNRL